MIVTSNFAYTAIRIVCGNVVDVTETVKVEVVYLGMASIRNSDAVHERKRNSPACFIYFQSC